MKNKWLFALSFYLLSFSSKAQINISSSDSIICAGETVTLTAHTFAIYNYCYWSTGNIINTKTITVTPSVITSYSVACYDDHSNSVTGTYTQTVFTCTDIKKQSSQFGFNLYPNPTNGRFVIQGLPVSSRVTVYSSLGLPIFQSDCMHQVVELNLSGNEPGIYFIAIETADTRIIRKVFLE